MFESTLTDRLRFHVPAVQHDLQVPAFDGDDAISRLYSFDTELVSENPRLPLEPMLHPPLGGAV